MAKPQTVLLTGATGYIAKHIVVKLLNAGYNLVGSVRSLSRGDEVVAAVTPHLNDPKNLDKRLRFVALDLNNDDGWDDAMIGIDLLIHTASPFPLAQPKHEDELIRPAVDGALRALRAAHKAGIQRVVLTSSFAAVMETELPSGRSAYDESDWSDPNSATISAYSKSKTLAEMAAWKFVRDESPDMQLTTINPSMVLGPPLDIHFGGSVQVLQRILRGKDPMLPKYGLSCVDVRDVADMHVNALSMPDSIGLRVIAAEKFLWFRDVAMAVQPAAPGRNVVKREAPNFLIRLLGIIDSSVRQIIPGLGKRFDVDNTRAKEVLKIDFMPAEASIEETAWFLIEHNQV